MTPRYRHLAYTEDFGNEMFDLVAQSIDKDVLALELKRYITEALMYNEYIRELNGFEFEIEGSKATVRFNVVSVYGEIEYEQEMKAGVE